MGSLLEFAEPNGYENIYIFINFSYYMRAYVAAPFKGGNNKEEIKHFCSLVKESGFEDFCFVRDVQKEFDDSKELMKEAKEELECSDVLIVDMTNASTGCAIEAGMAFEMGKRVVSLVKKGERIKNTTSGISDAVIEYENFDDIVKPLNSLFLSWNKKLS